MYQRALGIVLLWRVDQVSFDGKPIDVRNANLFFGWSWQGACPGTLKAGSHEITIKVVCAYVDENKMIGLNANNLPEELWPASRKRWTQSVSSPLSVYRVGEPVVALVNDARRSPGPNGGIKIDRLAVQPARDGKKKIVMEVSLDPNPPTIAVSYDAAIAIPGLSEPVPLGAVWIVPQKGGSASSGNLLEATVDRLGDTAQRAQLLLTPNPNHVDQFSQVTEIWGEKVTIKGVPLERLDQEAVSAENLPDRGPSHARGKTDLGHPDRDDRDREQIVGTWKAVDSSSWDKLFKKVGVSADGKTEVGVQMTHEEAKAAADREPTVITKDLIFGFYHYTLDPSKNPKTIDLFLNGRLVLVGIYELEGDRLQFHFSKTPQRPKSFVREPADEEADTFFEVLERATPAAGSVGHVALPKQSVDTAVGKPVGKAEGDRTFGPLIERMVNDWRKNPMDSVIDLDSGKLFSMPEDLLPKPGEQPASKKQAGEKWGRDNGVDAGGVVWFAEELPPGEPKPAFVGRIGLGGLDMFATHADSADWDRITPVEIESRLAQAKLEYRGLPNAKGDMLTDREFPATFLFQTREGGTGILQIVGFSEKPKAVKIRYKLVQSHSPVAETQSAVPFEARLPDGIGVELLGIAENPSQNRPWWRPDGSPLAERPYNRLGASAAAGKDEIAREIAIRLHNLPSESVATQWQIEPSLASATREPPGLGTSLPNVRAVAVRMAAGTQTATVRSRRSERPVANDRGEPIARRRCPGRRCHIFTGHGKGWRRRHLSRSPVRGSRGASHRHQP